MTHLPALTPLRGIAALLVVLFHYVGQSLLPNLGGGSIPLFAKGYLAVDLFFLMSGFVIAHVYAGWFQERISSSTVMAFIRARFARIYPVHIFVLALYVIIDLGWNGLIFLGTGNFDPLPWEGRFSLGALLKNLVLVHGVWSDARTWNHPSWSISVEFFTYLLFPFAVVAVWRGGRAITLAAVAGLFAALAWLAHRHGGLDIVTGQAFFRCLIQFLIGMLLYRLYWDHFLSDLLRRDATFIAAAGATLAILYYGAPDILVVPAFMVLIMAGVQNGGRMHGLINAKPLVWLGNISYSVYMIHALVEDTTRKVFAITTGSGSGGQLGPAQSMLVAIGMVALVLVAADVMYRFIEVPARRLLKGRRSAPTTSRAARRRMRLLASTGASARGKN